MAQRATQAKPFRPPDAAELNRSLDFIAEVMDANPRVAHLAMPIWRALERELEKAVAEEAIRAKARDRLKRSIDQTAARSS